MGMSMKNMIYVPFLLILRTIPAPLILLFTFQVLLDIHGYNTLMLSYFRTKQFQ